MHRSCRSIFFHFFLPGFILLFIPLTANARPSFPNTWQTTYPASESYNNSGCQLCHQNDGGGNGWNAYGWAIRTSINDEGNSIENALAAVEGNNSDLDSTDASNLTEINLSTQPGWATGAVNTIYFQDGSELTNQNPPDIIDIDPPEKLEDPISETISSGLKIELTDVATGLTSPNFVTFAPGLSGYIFVVDQVGIIWKVNLDDSTTSYFLDISDQLVTLGAFGNFDERGLLGLAFHPEYATNGLLYTYQSEPVNGTADYSTIPEGESADHQTVIAEWQVTSPADPSSTVNTSSKRVVLRIDQPQFNHDGGMLAFGPDNYLYISLGDGGGADDVDGQDFLDTDIIGHNNGNGQDATNPLGAILRIDPSGTASTNGQYSNPADNPFTAGDDERLDEIYAYGLRNPFRFSFDRSTGNLYAGDVGQNDIEEINLITNGGNYGWNAKEGEFYFYPNGNDDGYVSSVAPADINPDLIDPVLQYDHDEGISVMGGYVYRGEAIPSLQGTYIFGDWSLDFGSAQGRIFYSEDMENIKEFSISGQESLGIFLNGFGEDESGELYIVGNTTGTPTGTTGVVRKITGVSKKASFFVIGSDPAAIITL